MNPSPEPPEEAGHTQAAPAGLVPSSPPPATSRYDTISRRLSSRAALLVGAGWGFAEATLFFIVPDVWLGLVALYAPRRTFYTLLAIVAGAAVGATVLYLATLAFGGALSDVIVALPGIAVGDLDAARGELAAQGPIAFLNGILQALPVKVYIHAAALDGIDLWAVATATVANRFERMVVFGLVLAIVGRLARARIARWPRATALVYAIGWIIFYAGFLLGTGA